MEPTSSWPTKTLFRPNEQTSPEQLPPSYEAERTLEVKTDVIKRPTGKLIKSPLTLRGGADRATQNIQRGGPFRFQDVLHTNTTIADQPTAEIQHITEHPDMQPAEASSIADLNTWHLPTMTRMQSQPLVPSVPPFYNAISESGLEIIDTLKLPHASLQEAQPTNAFTQAIAGYHIQQKRSFTQRKALLLIALLCMILLQAVQQGSQQIFGSQGWAYVLGGPSGPKTNLLGNVGNQLRNVTPQQYIDTIIQSMTLEQKLGQMMLVQFVGSDFSLDLNTMVSQYHVGSVLLLTGNHNIINKGQLTDLTRQIQHNSALPMIISLDQEGGLVDRLADLDGPRPSPARIAATGDPTQATEAGQQDAQDLSQYGINLQLAPVVDVGTPYSLLQQQGRTFGQNADTVTQMAGAYLQGLQKSGKVLGTLKHFPGLGSITTDPHRTLPRLNHTQEELDQIDWAPYHNLINQGLAHAIMVTHEVVTTIDPTTPASLSSKLVTGVLRDQMGFQGVIMTDSLTMEGVSAYYTTKQAAVLAVEAGSDIIMGADTPSTVATMVEGIKEAISTGEISKQRIDQSVSRILMMKYQMGLLTLPRK